MSKAPRVALQDAWNDVEGLSRPSKMPCYSYNISALRCKVGSLLREIKGTTCGKCYALTGNYMFPAVQDALERRYVAIFKPPWVDSMATLIDALCSDVFRWHDSGDIQSVGHLDKIVNVARLTPRVRHWLPTREYKMVEAWRAANGDFPSNLVVRLSAHKVDGQAPQVGLPTSTVTSRRVGVSGECPSLLQDNKCGDCRACWETTGNVAYIAH